MKRWFAMVAAVTAAVFALGLAVYWPWNDAMPTEPMVTQTVPVESGVSQPPNQQGTIQGMVSFQKAPPVPEEYMEYSCQYLPEEVENPDDLPVLKWVVLGGFMNTAVKNEEPVRELNQMLADRNMPFRIQIVRFSFFAKRTPFGTEAYVDWFSRPDSLAALEDADLITASLTAQNMEDYLMPITAYVTGDAQPSLENAVPHELNWIKGSVDGEIYAINSVPYLPFVGGWTVKTEFMEKYGLTAADFQRNFWEMDGLFAQIYEKNGNKPFLRLDSSVISGSMWSEDRLRSVLPGSLNMELFELRHHIGATYTVDTGTGTPKVENILETQELRSMRAAFMRYLKAGYGPAEPNPYTGEPADVCYSSIPGICSYSEMIYDWEVKHIAVTPSVYGDVYCNRGASNGVAATSEYQEEAVALLNLIAEDKAFRNQLLYGKEGRDYTVEDGVYKVLPRKDGTSYGFGSLSPYSDLEECAYSSIPVYEGMTRLESYRYMLDHVDVVHMPVRVCYAGFEEELSAIWKLYNQYFYEVTDIGKGKEGEADYRPPFTDADYDKMLQEIKTAGGDRIQAELQRQLDEWLAENPDWQ